jgi:2-dehydropantoate 2-reductase
MVQFVTMTTLSNPLHICILGAGALGSAMGGVLAQAGHIVTLINRRQAHVDAINSKGLILRARGVDRVVAVRAVTHCREIDVNQRGVDVLLILVKSFDTESAMQAALPLVSEQTVVLTLQNGMGHEAILSRLVGEQKVLTGKTYAGGVVLAPGLVTDSTHGKETIIGELNGCLSARAQRIASAFTDAGLSTQISTSIMTTIWDKLLVNAATGAVSAISGLPYGPLYEQKDLEATALAAVSEGMAVAQAAGVAISFTHPREPWLKAGSGLPRDFKPSMLQSLEKGSITEIDYINGAIVEMGKALGVPTPVNATLVACIKGIESKLLLQC